MTGSQVFYVHKIRDTSLTRAARCLHLPISLELVALGEFSQVPEANSTKVSCLFNHPKPTKMQPQAARPSLLKPQKHLLKILKSQATRPSWPPWSKSRVVPSPHRPPLGLGRRGRDSPSQWPPGPWHRSSETHRRSWREPVKGGRGGGKRGEKHSKIQ